MATYKIALKVKPKQFSKLLTLANAVVVALTGNVNFLPAPTLVALQTAINNVIASQALAGVKGNRGSHAAYEDLVNKALTLYNLLIAEAAYCLSAAKITAGDDAAALKAILETCGFPFVLAKSPVGTLQQVQNFRNIKDKALDVNKFRARFKRPLNTNSPRDVNSYEVWVGSTPVFAAATQFTTVTATTFTYSNTSGAPVTLYFFVRGVGASGPGAVSDVLKIQLGA